MAESPMRENSHAALQMEDWIVGLGKPVGKVPYAGTYVVLTNAALQYQVLIF